MQRSLQEILERLLAGQQEIREGQKEILAIFRGSTTCRTETTSCPGEMDWLIQEQQRPQRIQDSVASRQKSSAARKRVIRRAVPAARKRNMRKGPGKNNVARGASKGKMLGKRQRNNCECENGRFDRNFKDQLCQCSSVSRIREATSAIVVSVIVNR
jgi:hypothetical protein